ncbi:MAG: hypothetical protein ACI4J0_08270 [Huintestinicola sp.]|uniref:hypothetical protein n=1 Tax=Huintestinicola sp. TaxID=2981661 RepID=UPI003F009236
MNIINLIQQKYGDTCQLCSPLDEKQFDEAQKVIPNELLSILQFSDGIEELMTHPDANDGKPFVIGSIVYSFDEIKSETKSFFDLYGDEGTVFAGNGAGGYFVLKPDGTIYLYEYLDEDGEYYAASLSDYFAKF